MQPRENQIDPHVAEAAARVREMIAQGCVDTSSAVAIVRAAAAAGVTWDSVEDVVAEIAKGADGISGTADDLIPAATLDMLTSLLNSGVVRDVVSWASDLASAAVDVATGGCLAWFRRLFGI